MIFVCVYLRLKRGLNMIGSFAILFRKMFLGRDIVLYPTQNMPFPQFRGAANFLTLEASYLQSKFVEQQLEKLKPPPKPPTNPPNWILLLGVITNQLPITIQLQTKFYKLGNYPYPPFLKINIPKQIQTNPANVTMLLRAINFRTLPICSRFCILL